MNQPSSTVIQPTHTFRIQLSPDTAAEASYSTLTKAGTGYASPSSYTLQASFDGEPLLRETTSLNLDRFAPTDTSKLPPISYGRYGDAFAARVLSEAIFKELGDLFRSFQDQNDGYVRVQLQIDGPDGDIHDLPWEYLTLPGGSDQPLAADERTPFARLIGQRPREYHPNDEQALRVLVVFEDAVSDEPNAVSLDSSVVRGIVDSLSGLTESSRLQVTLLTGTAYDIALPSDRFQLVYALRNTFSSLLEKFHILHFVPAGQERLPLADRYRGLSWALDNARRLPPLMVLPSDFVRQSQTRQLTSFGDQGAVAVLEMPDFDPEPMWLGLQVFYERLLEHGIADIALNQLRRSWIDNSRFPPQLPILWTAVEDGRLFARSILDADERGIGPETPEPLAEPIAPYAAPDQSTQQTSAPPVGGAAQGASTTPAEPSAAPGAAPSKKATKARKSTRQLASTPPSDQTKETQGHPSQSESKPESPAPATEQAETGPAHVGRAGSETGGTGSASGTGAPAGATSGAGAGGGGQPPIILVDLSRYDPPEPDNVMTIRVGTSTVTLHFDAKDGLPTDYSGPNRLADPAYQQQILQATTDRKRYGNLLFDAIIHNEPGPGGQVELTTEKGFDLALSRTSRKLRIELELDQNNLAIHEYRWEFLRRGERTPVALLERAPLYRRLAGTNQPLLVPGDSQLKVLVAICNPSTESRAKYSVIETLPALDVRLETEIANLALQRLKAAQLLTYDILPKHPEEVVTRQMLLDRIEQEGYHVVHLVCHGVFVGDNPPGDYYLAIEGEKDQLPFLAAGDFSQWIGVDQVKNRLRLVVLAACQSAVSSTGDALRGLGPRLVLEGQVPAVIAMQEKLPFDTAQLFIQSFYDDLARSGRVDMALAATRQTIHSREGGDAGTWGIPVLFLSAAGWQDSRNRQAESRGPEPSRPGHPHLSPTGRQRGPAPGRPEPDAGSRSAGHRRDEPGRRTAAHRAQRIVRAIDGPGHAAESRSADQSVEAGRARRCRGPERLCGGRDWHGDRRRRLPPDRGGAEQGQAHHPDRPAGHRQDDAGPGHLPVRDRREPGPVHRRHGRHRHRRLDDLRYRGGLCTHHGADAGVSRRQLLAGHFQRRVAGDRRNQPSRDR